MMDEPASVSTQLRLFAGAGVLIAVLLGYWVSRHSTEATEPLTVQGAETYPRTAPEVHAATSNAQLDFASDGIPLLPSGSAPAPASELRHPHPITPQHERIYRENNLTFALDGAVDTEDAPGIRRLLATYRDEFPEDSLVLQQGYSVIADCLEHPNADTRAAAQRFYDTEIASALRRHVRRHCLEKR